MHSPSAPNTTAEKPTGARFSYATGDRPLAGYTIKRGIGHGGFGEVFYATSDAGKEVALKLIRRNLDVEIRGVTQCLNLKHPNLVGLYDIREDDGGDTWVIMEHVAGPSLERVLIDSPNGLPIPEALEWFHGLAAGVSYLHDHGIVHRDLKPANIFREEGIVKLGDYGLSKFISVSRRSGQTESVGTVHYMAPEIANGRYGKEIDIYALGVILYEMLTGRVPFEGESVGEVLMKHLTAPPNLNGLPEPFATVIGRTLTKDPAQRFSTVGQMVAALRGAGGSARGSEEATPVSPIDVRRRSRRKFGCGSRSRSHWRKHASKGMEIARVEAARYEEYWRNRRAAREWKRQQKEQWRMARSTSWRADRDRARAALAAKPARERLTELTGSMLIAAAVALVCVAASGLMFDRMDEPGQTLWMSIVVTLGAWGVMAVSKFWEGREGPAVQRRGILLLVGGVLGVASYLLARGLLISLPLSIDHIPDWSSGLAFDASGRPTLIGHVAYFAAVFAIFRWWKFTDPLRRSRVSVVGTAVVAAVAYFLSILCPYPQPIGAAVATSIAIISQLSSLRVDVKRFALRPELGGREAA